MKKVDYLVIGGSAAGTTAAEVIRSLSPNSSITIVTDENYEQYSRVLLPHYIRGKVSREQVFLKKPDWYVDKNIELTAGIKAIKLNPNEHQVVFSDESTCKYGKLLIAIGGYVIKLGVPGADLENVLYMRTIEDGDKIVKVASSAAAKALADKQSAKAVIVGGGFIGLEFCSCFKVNGVKEITVLVLEDYYWQGKLDEQSSKVLAATLTKNGIKILTNEGVERFDNVSSHSRSNRGSDPRFPSRGGPAFGGREDDQMIIVRTKSGKQFEAQAVGIGVGIKSDLSWLSGSGIKINQAIVTNEYLETNLSDVYAAGDCAEFQDVVFGRQHIMGNWANATSQGNAVGRTMGGVKTVFETASSYSINFFDGSCTFIGVTDEKFADETITRGTVAEGKMTRIFIKQIRETTRIVGATVINDPAQVSPLTMAVKNKVDIAKYKDKLGNEKFDLRGIVS